MSQRLFPEFPGSCKEDDLTPELFDKFARFIYDRARISLGKNKIELVRARFGKVIRRRRMSGFQEYFDWVESDRSGEAIREVFNAISTNLTAFFRENDHFTFLGSQFLPNLTRTAGGNQSPRTKLRGWSAGCSTGEEVYSIAMTVQESLPRPEAWEVKLLATDIDTEVVAHGQRGLYSEDRLRDMSPAMVRKYFDQFHGDDGRPVYQVAKSLRDMVTFRYMNLFSDWPFRNQFHFIFCRNVMIYFDRPTQALLINRFYQTLVSGGYLFIGHSESLSGVSHEFEYVRPTIYLKR